MKTVLLFLATLFVTSVQGQGTLNISPVPVTNGLTGTLADSSIFAALYFGPSGTTESSLVLLSPASALVNGFATFGSFTSIPPFPAGTPAVLQVRAWSSGFPNYESAAGSGLPSVLVGKSLALTATLGGSSGPPPFPTPLVFPGFTIGPVPEPAAGALWLLGVGILWRRRSQKPGPD
jgi:hypothetical protein